MVVFKLIRMYRRMVTKKAFGLAAVLTLLVIAVLGNTVCFYLFDRNVQEGLTLGDALWYSVISVTTIGYGDFSAQTGWARLSTFVFIVMIGLSAFSVFFGMVIDSVSEFALQRQKGLGSVMAHEHVLIVNFPSASRVQGVVEELRSDPGHHAREIVIVTDQVEQLPFRLENVSFVQGGPLQEETYQRANIMAATMAIVLSPSYNDANSDALVASAASVIDTLKPDIHIVGECIDEKHRKLFSAVRCDAIVSGLQIASNLLVQEVDDPGVTQMIDVITSNLRGDTLFSAAVDGSGTDRSYGELAKALLDREVNVLGVNRGTETLTNLVRVVPQAGDRVVYVAQQRHSWASLLALGG
jgi:voltage-gated potassium channel